MNTDVLKRCFTSSALSLCQRSLPENMSTAIMLSRGSNVCFHGFRSLVLYSTSVSYNDGLRNPLMVDCLTTSLGFSEEEAISVANKVKRSFNSSKKSKLVVDFLRNNGFDDSHIKTLVTSSPILLFNNVDKTLKPKIRVFQELGFYGSDLGHLMSRHPHVLSRSLATHIVPALEVLKSVFGSNEKLVKTMLKSKSQWMLANNVRLNLPENLLLLQGYGVPRQKILWLMLQRPLVMLQRREWLENIVKRVEEELHIPRSSGMFLHGVVALSMKGDEKLESWLQVFRSFGWSESEIFESIRRQPFCLTLSEKTIGVKLKYFLEELGYGSDYLSTRPTLLSHSLEKKVVPRVAVMEILRKKELLKHDISVFTYTSLSESLFLKKFVEPYKDELPQLYEDYIKMARGSL